MIRLISAKHTCHFKIEIETFDHKVYEVNLKDELTGPIFQPLREIQFFKRLRFDTELGTVVWPNGADFAPEFLVEMGKLVTTSEV